MEIGTAGTQTHVVVGGRLAGASGVETLRAEGFDGRVVLVGDEHERPYDRPLWASTAVKDPAYRGVHHVERLVAPGAIATLPERALRAFADHGTVARTFGADAAGAREVLAAAAAAAVDLTALAADLEREGAAAFRDSYERLLSRLAVHHEAGGLR